MARGHRQRGEEPAHSPNRITNATSWRSILATSADDPGFSRTDLQGDLSAWTTSRSFSAYRHGVSEYSIKHALRSHVDLFDAGDRMTMVIGPDRSGGLIEVGVVERYDDLYVVHAMPARPKFLR